MQTVNELFELIAVDLIQQEGSRYEQSILTGGLLKNHHEIMRKFHLAEKLSLAHRIMRRTVGQKLTVVPLSSATIRFSS